MKKGKVDSNGVREKNAAFSSIGTLPLVSLFSVSFNQKSRL
jgi:hypothetical protein